jgi:hypothetical protein
LSKPSAKSTFSFLPCKFLSFSSHFITFQATFCFGLCISCIILKKETMKTFNYLLKTAKNAVFVFALVFATAISAKAQPLYTQNTSGPAICDGFASLDSTFVELPVIWTNIGTGNVIGQDVFSASGLCPGDYTVTFNDINNNPITVTFSIGTGGNTNPCFGFYAVMNTTNTGVNACTGSADLTISGGTAPYTISWSNSGVTVNSISDLCVGSYTAVIVDANGCAYSASGYVAEDGVPTGDTVITIVNSSFPPNTVTDTLPTTVVTDCDIDHNSIASASITSVTSILIT